MARIKNARSRCVFVGVYFVAFFALTALSNLARAQTIQWIRQFGTTADDFGGGVAVDASGTYVVGGDTHGGFRAQVRHQWD